MVDGRQWGRLRRRDLGSRAGIGGQPAGQCGAVAVSDYTTTPNLNLYKPAWNADVDNWGLHWNANADTLDATLGTGAGGVFLPLAGGVMNGPLNYTATGGNTSRSAQARAAEVINVKDYGAVGNGTTDDSTAIQNAVNAGTTIFFPPGNYLLNTYVNVTGTGDTLFADPGTATLTVGPTNTQRPALLRLASGCINTVIDGLIFEGKVGAYGTPNWFELLMVQNWSDNVSIRRCRFQNANGTAITASGSQPISVALSAQANPNQAVMTFASVP